MKQLMLLLLAFTALLLFYKSKSGRLELNRSGNNALGIMLGATALYHLISFNEICFVTPDVLPYNKEMVLLCGIIEGGLAVCLLTDNKYKNTAGIVLILYFSFILPITLNQPKLQNDHEHAKILQEIGHIGFRIPLQLFFIFWTYIFTINFSRSDKENYS